MSSGSDDRSQGPALPARAAPPKDGAEDQTQGPALPARAAPPKDGAEDQTQGPALPARAAPPKDGAEDQKTVVITGISGRLGRIVARRLHHDIGWRIVGLD